VLAALLVLAGCTSVPAPSPGSSATPPGGPTPAITMSAATSTPAGTTAGPTASAALPTRTPTSTLAPAPKPAPTFGASLVWSQDYLPRPPGLDYYAHNARTSDIAVTATGFVIVGSDYRLPNRDGVAASWTSPDGVAWQEHVSPISDPYGGLLSAVAAGRDALVAVGSGGIWRSTSGADWEQVGPATMLDGYQKDIAWGPAGFVAIGHDSDGMALIWRSSDGRTWEQATSSPALSAFCPNKIAGASLGYVAVGTDCGNGNPRPVIAESADGLTWVRAPEQASLAGQGRGDGVVPGGLGWIAFGRFTPPSAEGGIAMWVSADGLAWRRTAFLRPLPAFLPSCSGPTDDPWMTDITKFGPGYVAVGISTCSNDWWGAAWTSADGATWQSVLPPATIKPFWSMYAVAARDGRLVVAGGGPWTDYLPATVSAILGP
jgi:hypothetical protein